MPSAKRRFLPILPVLVATLSCSSTARGAPQEGAGPANLPRRNPESGHPRVLLDDTILQRLRAQVGTAGSGIQVAIADCEKADASGDLSAGFQGERFARVASSCALAWQVTGKPLYAQLGIGFLRAMLNDYQKVGDGKGGADVVTHDTGYAMRFFATYSALAYDWLYDAPGMTEAIRELCRTRFGEWSRFYRDKGYLRDAPGANYHAGYAVAVAMIAAALGPNEGGGEELGRFTKDELLGRDLFKAMSEGGPLSGGDWPEGWQYGALSVAHYAMALRAWRERGLDGGLVDVWARELLQRYVHGLLPSGREMDVGGDTGIDTPYLDLNGRILYAVLLASEDPSVLAAARAELGRAGLVDKDLPVLQALAEASSKPAGEPLAVRRSTFYLSPGTQRLYTRTSWTPNAVWLSVACSPPRVPDHQHFSAGNLVLSRGSDHLITDPSPYGSLSSLTSNAPTVEAGTLPDDYRPSQGPWGKSTGFTVAAQSPGGVTVARCDYADQYRFRDQAPDVERAMRSVIMLGSDRQATVVVWDEIDSDGRKNLELRFRSPATFQATARGARATLGSSSIDVARVSPQTLSARTVPLDTKGNCWDGPRGKCRFARHAGTSYEIKGTTDQDPIVHVLTAGPSGTSPSSARWVDTPELSAVVHDDAGLVVLRPKGESSEGSFTGPTKASYVLLDARALAAGKKQGASCVFPVPAKGARGTAAVVEIDASCNATRVSPLAAAPSTNERASARRGKAGCTVGGPPRAALPLALLALLSLRRRRPCRERA